MTSTLQRTQRKAWAKAIGPTATEFGLTALPILSGTLPAGLAGTLYRNGPAQFERGGERVGHWFDGDGAVLAVHFAEDTVQATYRFVQTEGYQTEERAGKLLYNGYGTLAPGAWQRFSKGVKNVANTSVIALPDKLLALWEGGLPHALDLQTLQTIGPDALGSLEPDWTFSAHPKRDPRTGEIFNFGLTFGQTASLHLYRSNRSGQVQQHNTIKLDSLPVIHDFALAGPYLVFCIAPLQMSVLPVLTRLKSFSDALTWHPERGTQILVIDRQTLQVVSQSEAEPWYQWHFSNGYIDQAGSIVLNLVRYEDFQTNQYLKEIPTGNPHTKAKGTLWELRLDPKSGEMIETYELCDRASEFPLVLPHKVGQPSQFTYMAMHRQGVDYGQELLGTIARYDHQTGAVMAADLGENCYPMEPIFAPNPHDPEQGWIVTVVFDGDREVSEVWVFESDRLDAEPVCKLALPSVIPMGFHGTWNPA